MARQPRVQPLQPDFVVIADKRAEIGWSHANLAEEMGTCDHVPNLAGVDAIMGALNRLRTELRGELRDVTNSVRDLRSASVALATNSSARLENGAITTVHDPLWPLQNVTTNQPIPNFPQMKGDFEALPVAALNGILAELNLNQGGSVSQKRIRVMRHTGLQKFVPMPSTV